MEIFYLTFCEVLLHLATLVPQGFNYTSGENEHFLTVEELRELINKHVEQA